MANKGVRAQSELKIRAISNDSLGKKRKNIDINAFLLYNSPLLDRRSSDFDGRFMCEGALCLP